MVLKLLVSSSWQIGGLTSSFVIGTSLFVIDGLENVADWRVVDIRQWTCVCVFVCVFVCLCVCVCVCVCSVKRQCYCQLMVCCFRIVSRAFSAIITFHNRSVYLTPSLQQSSYSFIMIAAFLTEIYSAIKILMMRTERDGDTEKKTCFTAEDYWTELALFPGHSVCGSERRMIRHINLSYPPRHLWQVFKKIDLNVKNDVTSCVCVCVFIYLHIYVCVYLCIGVCVCVCI